MSSINDPEARAFLQEGTRTGKLSYLAADGRPLVAPVWFVLEGDSLVFNTHTDTAKGRSLARDPRISMCVDLDEPPYAFVQVQGMAELSEDPAELVSTATAIAVRSGYRNSQTTALHTRNLPATISKSIQPNSGK